MSRYKIFIVVAVMFLGGCEGPSDAVYSTEPMKVYLSRTVDNNEYGKFEYYIKDTTSHGWRLRINKKYSVGDELYIGVKK